MVLSMLANIVFMLSTQLTLNTLDVLKQSSNIVHIIFIMLSTSTTQNLSPIATTALFITLTIFIFQTRAFHI